MAAIVTADQTGDRRQKSSEAVPQNTKHKTQNTTIKKSEEERTGPKLKK
jgi:hypothetical protein